MVNGSTGALELVSAEVRLCSHQRLPHHLPALLNIIEDPLGSTVAVVLPLAQVDSTQPAHGFVDISQDMLQDDLEVVITQY